MPAPSCPPFQIPVPQATPQLSFPPTHLMGPLRGWLLPMGSGVGLPGSCGGGCGYTSRLCLRLEFRLGLRALGRGSGGLPLVGLDPLSQSCQGEGPHRASPGPGPAPHTPSHGCHTALRRPGHSTGHGSSQEVMPEPDLEAALGGRGGEAWWCVSLCSKYVGGWGTT